MSLRAFASLRNIHPVRPSARLLRSHHSGAQTLMQDASDGFGFIRNNPRPPKPRKTSVTEIRGPYYSVMGKRYLSDVLETMGQHVDGLKFAGGSFSLFQEDKLRELINLAHEHDVYVSTVRVLSQFVASIRWLD